MPDKDIKRKDLTPKGTHLPADLNLQEQIKADLEAAQEQVEASAVERIRMSTKGFSTPDMKPGEAEATVRGVIVDFISANMHYPEEFDRDNPTPPDCFAMGRIPAQMAPDPKATKPQADSCKECPMNKFESGKGKAKACKNTRQLAFMQENATEDSPIWLLTVPPGSIRYYDTYVSTTLRGRYALPPIGVLTEVSMDTSKDYASPRFKYLRSLADDELAGYYARKAEAEAVLLQKPITTT